MADAILVRPDGRAYRPRKSGLRARAWENAGHWFDEGSGVIVFGTLEPDQAQTFALESAVHWFGTGTVGRPVPGWWRDAFESGERRWVEDERRGAPGVMFTWEPTYCDQGDTDFGSDPAGDSDGDV